MFKFQIVDVAPPVTIPRASYCTCFKNTMLRVYWLLFTSKKKYTDLKYFFFCHCLLSMFCNFNFLLVALPKILLIGHCSLWTSLVLCQRARICQRRRLHLPLQLLWKYLLSIKQLKASDLQSSCSYSAVWTPELVSWHLCHFLSIYLLIFYLLCYPN